MIGVLEGLAYCVVLLLFLAVPKVIPYFLAYYALSSAAVAVTAHYLIGEGRLGAAFRANMAATGAFVFLGLVFSGLKIPAGLLGVVLVAGLCVYAVLAIYRHYLRTDMLMAFVILVVAGVVNALCHSVLNVFVPLS